MTDSPSRNDAFFFFLRVAARLRRGDRVGSYLVRSALAPTIRASFSGSSGGASTLNRDARAPRRTPPRAKLRHSLKISVCMEETAPSGGWVRRRRRWATERRHCRQGRRNGLSSSGTIFFVFQTSTANCEAILFWTGEKGDRLELSVNENAREGASRVNYGDEAVMENGIRGWCAETHDPHAHHH